MANLYDNRRENLRRLIEQWSGPSALGEKLGYSNVSFLVQIAGPNPTREVTERTARKIEKSLDLPPAWLDGMPEKGRDLKVDTSAVADVIRLTGQMAEEAGVKMTNSKFADLVHLAYQDAQESGAVRPDFIRSATRHPPLAGRPRAKVGFADGYRCANRSGYRPVKKRRLGCSKPPPALREWRFSS